MKDHNFTEKKQTNKETNKKTNENMVVNDIKISKKRKNKGFLSIEKDTKCKKIKNCYKHLTFSLSIKNDFS